MKHSYTDTRQVGRMWCTETPSALVPHFRSGTGMQIFYRRWTNPTTFEPYSYMKSDWASSNNVLNSDFSLYGSFSDAVLDVNRWQFCNYDDPGIGFPRYVACCLVHVVCCMLCVTRCCCVVGAVEPTGDPPAGRADRRLGLGQHSHRHEVPLNSAQSDLTAHSLPQRTSACCGTLAVASCRVQLLQE